MRRDFLLKFRLAIDNFQLPEDQAKVARSRRAGHLTIE